MIELGFNIEVGDLVDTGKGAKFYGVVIADYIKICDGSRGCNVEAVDMAFRGTLHVYPASQLKVVAKRYARIVNGAWEMTDDGVGNVPADKRRPPQSFRTGGFATEDSDFNAD